MSQTHPPPRFGLLKIGQIAGQVGVAASALRFYEREGLIRPTTRSQAGYRLYETAVAEQIRFIRAGQAIGFSLEDIKTLLVLDEDTSCRQVQSMLERRLNEVETKLANLQKVKSTLAGALGRCRSSNRGCAVVEDLKGKSKDPRPK